MIFVDTSFFYALASANDPDHQRVRQVFESFAGRRLREVLVTSNHTVFETIRLTRRRRGHRAAVEMGEQLYAEKMARIDWTTPEEERAAFDYMVKYHDKDYSPVTLSLKLTNPVKKGKASVTRRQLSPGLRRQAPELLEKRRR